MTRETNIVVTPYVWKPTDNEIRSMLDSKKRSEIDTILEIYNQELRDIHQEWMEDYQELWNTITNKTSMIE